MSEVRRSERLAKKQEDSTKVLTEYSSSKKADSIADSTTKADSIKKADSIADSTKKAETNKSENKTRSRKSRSSGVSSQRKKVMELEINLKKAELEQELLKKQQEIWNLQTALRLANIEEESESDKDENGMRTESVVSVTPNIDTWMNGGDPWNDKMSRIPSQVNRSRIQNSEKSIIVDTTKQYQTVNPQITKILTRQSVPKELPIFSGDPTEWPNFIVQYRNSTKLCGFSNEENQCRLNKCLKGNAKKIVQSLLILPQNVDKVISLLENRFGRPEHIIFLLLDRIKKLPNIREDKLDMLINFSDEVKNFIGTIEALEEYDHLRNPMLLNDLLNKLPMNYRLTWIEHISKTLDVEHKLVEFSSWLEIKSNAACQLQIPQFSDNNFDNQKSKYRNAKRDVTLTTKTANKKCSCCTKDIHHLSLCPSFKSYSTDERWSFITNNKMCFSCLLPYHGIKDCRKKKKCNIDGCQKPHHELLHHKTNESTNSTPAIENNAIIESNCHILTKKKVLLKILPVIISNGDESIETFALLDDASTVSLIDQDLADELHLTGPKQSLCLQWTNNQVNELDDSRVVSFKIHSHQTDKNSNYYLRHVRTIQGLSLPRQTINMEDICRDYPYVDHRIISMFQAEPKLLIGQDNWPLLVSRQIINGPWNGPAISKTLLGWVLHGNYGTNERTPSKQMVCFINSKVKDDLDILHELVKEQWKTENIGSTKKVMSKEDVRAQGILDSTMRRVGNKFETGLLWKNENQILPESKNNAFKRLLCTERKMDKNKTYGNMYCEKILDMEKKGYITKLSNEETREYREKLWYLPHFGVVNPNKPNKLRIVFDAAAKSNGVSLNDCLLSGPDLYNSLYTILLNFRIKRVAFTADIKEMFLQVNVRKDDRAAQRILFRGMNRQEPPETYEINVVFFGSTSGPCLAQEAKNRNARDFADRYPEAVKAITNYHYMDDYLGNADCEEEAKRLVNEVINIHKHGGFTICNWITNTPEVIRDLNPILVADSQKCLENNTETSTERILGVWWNPEEDSFCFKTKFHKIDKAILDNERRPTKREILKVVMSIFDPLGFLANFMIIGKILLQDIWRSQIGWDDEITDILNKKWENWIKDLKNISHFSIPRQYCTLDRQTSEIQIHVFCDASENACASVAYLRWQKNSEVKVCFVSAKTKVAPLKPTSIPRLELQAALMGARLGTILKDNLELIITETFYWTDSKTVLNWINSEARGFMVYVAQRIGEIQELTNPSQWRHVGSKQNVADEATKYYEFMDYSSSSRWIHGPSFLYKPNEEWPPVDLNDISGQDDDGEERREFVFVNFIKENFYTPDPERFSKWTRLLRATTWMKRFIDNCRNKNNRKDMLDLTELKESEKILFRKMQEDSFPEEVTLLSKNKYLSKSSRLFTFNCEFDPNERLIRLGGRLNNCRQLGINAKNPIILDPKHKITKLIIQHYHEEVNHHGQETVINNLRQNFWILRMRQAVRSCWANCQKCKNRKSLPKIPIMGQLPICRLEPTVRPFIKTGVDYFGPIEVAVKRSIVKRYGVIFTCMVTRAIHLEIANDLSTDGFIHVLRQFGCRRGFPEEIYSDNGSCFKGADRELSENLEKLNQSDIKKYCTLKSIKWFWNPSSAPHMGGTWERLIQSIKKNMKEILKNKHPQEYILRTIFAEIENILNSRPLTHVSVDPDDPEALTPNHFLIGPSYAALPCTDTDEKNIDLMSKWRTAQKIIDIFWQRWSKEYLPSISKRTKWFKDQDIIKLNDIVLIVDPNGLRNTWHKGKVTKLYPAKDGRIRVVDVTTSNGNTLKRPVSRLCILDVTRKEQEEKKTEEMKK